MAPCVVDANTKVGKDAMKALNLASIRKAIPEEAFKKNAFISAQYMLRDYALWIASVYGIYRLSTSPLWDQMPFWQKAVATVVYWNLAGFWMWCIFMIGHDCGHTTFAESELVNDVVGLFSHGSILLPFHPWQVIMHALQNSRLLCHFLTDLFFLSVNLLAVPPPPPHVSQSRG